MRTRVCLSALALCLIAIGARAETHRIDWLTSAEVAETIVDGEPMLTLENGFMPEGARWPARIARVEIPPDARVESVSITAVTEHQLGYPVASYRVPTPDVDLGTEAATSAGYAYWVLPSGDFRGHRVAHVMIAPFRTDGDDLLFLSAFEIEVTTSGGHEPALARRIPHPRTEAADLRGLRSILDAEPVSYDGSTQNRAPVTPELPPETVEYIVVTNEDMSVPFQEFADYKTREGIPTRVTTVEWILANYEGIDLAARIRSYLRDAYLYQGLRYALLGGDTDQVPTRIAINRFQNPTGAPLTTDRYFAMLDGNWNADGDEEMGEAPNATQGFEGDHVDLYYEIPVGRVPASSLSEAESFLNKWKSYTGYDPDHFRDDYQNRMLSLAEVLFPDDWEVPDDPIEILLDGAEIAESTLVFLPQCFEATRLYQNYPEYPGSIEETKEAAIQYFNQGYGMVDHIGHGFRANMSVGDDKLENVDVDAFTNTDAYSVLYAVNCTSGAVGFDCIVEHLMNNPNGGTIASIASTDLDFPTISDNMKYEFFRQVFQEGNTTIGDAFYTADLPWVPIAVLSENSYRWTIMALILVGEPSMEVWNCTPDTLDVAYDPTFELGTASASVTVTDDGLPVEGVRVTFWKDDGYGVAHTDGAGIAVVPFLPASEGTFQVTAVKNGFVPAVGTATVSAATTAALRVEGYTFHDGTGGGGTGNADGRPDAGESVVIDLILRNDGTAPATGVSTVLHANTTFAAVTDSTATGIDIPAGNTDTILAAFTLDITADLPDSLRHVVAPAVVDLIANEGSWQEEASFSLYQRIIDIVGLTHTIPDDDGDGWLEPGETIEVTPTLRNRGEAVATAVVAVGSYSGSDFAVLDDTIQFGDIAPGETVEMGSLRYLSTGGNRLDLDIDFTASDTYATSLLQREIDVVIPPSPDTLYAAPSSRSIRVIWPRPISADTRGYKIYRATSTAGPFVEISEDIVEDGSFYVDEDLDPLTPYLYRVASIDSSGNMSAPSDTLFTSTSPPILEGWPVDLPSGESKGSPTFADLGYDGSFEILLGWSVPMVFTAAGGDFVDGDGDGLTTGVFSTIGDFSSKFWNSPAVGDIDGDDVQEIVFMAWNYDSEPARMYVLDETGAVEPGWPQIVGSQPWSTAALADVDLDGDEEIFVSSGAGGGDFQGVLFGFHHDGSEVVDGDSNPATHGVFYKSASTDARFMYTSPAVADLDDNGDDEIIFFEKTEHTNPSQGTLYVFDGNGSVWPGFPYGDAATKGSTSSPAVADLDDNGDLEIIALTESQLLVVNDDGSDFPGFPLAIPPVPGGSTGIRDFLSSPAIGDVDNDGVLDIVFGWQEGALYVVDGVSGAPHPGFPATLIELGSSFDRYLRSPVLANIDGDPNPEVIISSTNNKLFAVNHDAAIMPGFPLELPGAVFGSTAAWDIDRDGFVNLVVQTDAPTLLVYDFNNVPFVAAENPWPMFRHDQKKRGAYTDPVAVSVGDEPTASVTPALAAAYPARPNPFIPRVDLPFDVPGAEESVKIRVFDVKGREVRVLADGRFPGGAYRISWDGRTANGQRLSPGVYFARIEIGAASFVQKLTMLR